MTRLIGILIVVLVLFGGWALFQYWEKVRLESYEAKKAAPEVIVSGEQLSGLPYQLVQSLEAAEKQGVDGLRNWLQTYGNAVQDPRKAWIELDYCTLVARNNPQEARRIYAEVKKRTSQSSPVWPRIQELQKSFE